MGRNIYTNIVLTILLFVVMIFGWAIVKSTDLKRLREEKISKQLEQLEAGAEGEDWMIATYTLKGAARAVGAWSLAEAAEHLEALDPAIDHAACGERLERLRILAAECAEAIAVAA